METSPEVQNRGIRTYVLQKLKKKEFSNKLNRINNMNYVDFVVSVEVESESIEPGFFSLRNNFTRSVLNFCPDKTYRKKLMP